MITISRSFFYACLFGMLSSTLYASQTPEEFRAFELADFPTTKQEEIDDKHSLPRSPELDQPDAIRERAASASATLASRPPQDPVPFAPISRHDSFKTTRQMALANPFVPRNNLFTARQSNTSTKQLSNTNEHSIDKKRLDGLHVPTEKLNPFGLTIAAARCARPYN